MLLRVLLLSSLATLVLSSATDPERVRHGSGFELQRREEAPVASPGSIGDLASAYATAVTSNLGATETASATAHKPDTLDPAPTPLPKINADRRGLLDPLLGLLTVFIPPKVSLIVVNRPRASGIRY